MGVQRLMFVGSQNEFGGLVKPHYTLHCTDWRLWTSVWPERHGLAD